MQGYSPSPLMPESTPSAELPAELQGLIEHGMALYAREPQQADFLFAYALSLAPEVPGLYRILYKFYHRQRRDDLARELAQRGLQAAARQAGLPAQWSAWSRAALREAEAGAASQALLALKALAFFSLRAGDTATAEAILARLHELDPDDGSGASVVTALMSGVQG